MVAHEGGKHDTIVAITHKVATRDLRHHYHEDCAILHRINLNVGKLVRESRGMVVNSMIQARSYGLQLSQCTLYLTCSSYCKGCTCS